MKKMMLQVAFLCSIVVLMSSCRATMHTVGTGGKGDCKSQYDATEKQMYLFWGLLPLNKVDSKAMAGGATNYTIRTTTTFVDGLINGIGAYLLGFQTQTIRVSKGN